MWPAMVRCGIAMPRARTLPSALNNNVSRVSKALPNRGVIIMKSWFRCCVPLITSAVFILAVPAGAAGPSLSAAKVRPLHIAVDHRFTAPPTNTDCLTAIGLHCYGPPQFARAYNLTALHQSGIDGRGTTIV